MPPRHSFAAGQTVRLANASRLTPAASGDFKITRLLPESSGELQYRVKSDRESYERVVGENELKAQAFESAFKPNPPGE